MAAQQQAALLATGLARPFRRGPAGFNTATGLDKVRINIEQILATPIGKLPWRCGFGSRLTRLRHMNNNRDIQQLARVDASDAIQRWDSRCRVQKVTATPVGEGGRNKIDLAIQLSVANQTLPIRQDI